jgi:hypothetical protein
MHRTSLAEPRPRRAQTRCNQAPGVDQFDCRTPEVSAKQNDQ